MNLLQKLVELRKVVSYLQKDTEGHKYTYVSGSNLLGHLKDKMNELGLLFFIEVAHGVGDEYSGLPQMRTLYEEDPETTTDFVFTGLATCVWKDSDSEEELRVPFYCTGKQNDPSKAFGSALTYTERYFMLKFLNIATDDDDPDAFQDFIESTTPKQQVTKKASAKKFVKKATPPKAAEPKEEQEEEAEEEDEAPKAPVKKKAGKKKATKKASKKAEKKPEEELIDEESMDKIRVAFEELEMDLDEIADQALGGKSPDEWTVADKEIISDFYVELTSDDEGEDADGDEGTEDVDGLEEDDENSLGDDEGGLDEETMLKIESAFSQFDLTIEDIEKTIIGSPKETWTDEDKESIGEFYDGFAAGTIDPADYK